MSLRRYLRRRIWDEERARELEAHLAQETDDNVARGMTREEARRRAYMKLGNPTVIREEIWKMNSFVSVEVWGGIFAMRSGSSNTVLGLRRSRW